MCCRSIKCTRLWDPLEHRGSIEINRAAGSPFFHVICEVELHEMPSHGGKYHVAGLPIDSIGEEEQRVVWGAAQTIKPVFGMNTAESSGRDLQFRLGT